MGGQLKDTAGNDAFNKARGGGGGGGPAGIPRADGTGGGNGFFGGGGGAGIPKADGTGGGNGYFGGGVGGPAGIPREDGTGGGNGYLGGGGAPTGGGGSEASISGGASGGGTSNSGLANAIDKLNSLKRELRKAESNDTQKYDWAKKMWVYKNPGDEPSDLVKVLRKRVAIAQRTYDKIKAEVGE